MSEEIIGESAFGDVSYRNQPLRALVALCRELAKLKIGMVFRDSVPAVTVATGDPSVSIHVIVSSTGGDYIWNGLATQRHPVSDPIGAARLISEHRKNTPSGEQP